MNSIGHTLRVRHGISLIYVTVLMVVLIGFVSFAVDLGRLQLAKTQLQTATDAAARYGATGLNSGVATVKSMVVAAAAENQVDGSPLVIDPNNDIEFGIWNPATRTFTPVTGAAQSTAKALRVTGRRVASRGTAVPLSFASLLGLSTIDLRFSCVVNASSISDDVFLLQDITTSFTAQLPDAKIADKGLLDSLYTSGGAGRLAVAVHTGWGATLAPFTNISSNYTYLSSTINSIQIAGSPGMPVASGTDIASGFDEAVSAFTASGYVSPTGSKTVVLVSDGQPSANSSGKHPTLDSNQLLTLAQTRADTLWANNVHIYVVFMDADNDNTAATRLRTLIRGTGEFVRVSDPTQLPSALQGITDKIGGIHIMN